MGRDIQPQKAGEHVAHATGDDGVAGVKGLAIGGKVDEQARWLGILEDAQRLRNARDEVAARSGHEEIVQLVGPQLDGGGELAVAVGNREDGKPPAGDENLAIGSRDTGDEEIGAIGRGDESVEDRRGVGIRQRVETEHGILQPEDIVGVEAAVFIDVGPRPQRSREEVGAVEMVDEPLQVKDGRAVVRIQIAIFFKKKTFFFFLYSI